MCERCPDCGDDRPESRWFRRLRVRWAKIGRRFHLAAANALDPFASLRSWLACLEVARQHSDETVATLRGFLSDAETTLPREAVNGVTPLRT